MGLIEGAAIIIILLFSVILHEISHGWAAFSLGDPTAKYAGRLTLNPIKHLDPFGSILLPGILILMAKLSGGHGIIFGWAKPVPVNPYNFKDKKYGEAKVAIAGPLANIILAVAFGLLIRFGGLTLGIVPLFLLQYIVWINLVLAIFNLLPIPPLDGSHILFTFLPYSAKSVKLFLAQYGMFIIIFFIFFFSPIIFSIVNFLFVLITGTPFLLS